MKVLLFLVILKVIDAQSSDFSKFATFDFGGQPAENECKTNEDHCRCCKMLQKVDYLKKSLQNKLDMLEAELNSNMEVYNEITTKHSAFSATLFLDHNNLLCLGPFVDTRTIVYKKVFFNTGNNYNVATGIYTAPFSGVYSLSVSVFHDAGQNSNEQSCVSMTVNGNVIAGSSDSHTFDHEDSTTVSIAAHLNAGDRVEVKLKAGCLLCVESSHYNVFSSFLIYTD